MEVTLDSAPVESVRTGVLAVAAFEAGPLPPGSRRLDDASKGELSAVIMLGDLDETPGATQLLRNLPGVSADRVLLVSLGKRQEFGDREFREAFGSVARALANIPAHDAAIALDDWDVPGRSLAWRVQQATVLLADGAYRFASPWASNGGREPVWGARNVVLLIDRKVTPELESAVGRGQAVAEGIALA